MQGCRSALDRSAGRLRWGELTRIDNTMLAIQYATSLGIEESQIREMLGISKLRTTCLLQLLKADCQAKTGTSSKSSWAQVNFHLVTESVISSINSQQCI